MLLDFAVLSLANVLTKQTITYEPLGIFSWNIVFVTVIVLQVFLCAIKSRTYRDFNRCRQNNATVGLLQRVISPLAPSVMGIWWYWLLLLSRLVNSLVYYGLSFNSGNFGANIYLNIFLAGVVELPAYLVTMVVLDRFGRRYILTAFMVAGGAACLGCVPLLSNKSKCTFLIVFMV
jgi:hypothetical protein